MSHDEKDNGTRHAIAQCQYGPYYMGPLYHKKIISNLYIEQKILCGFRQIFGCP